MPTSSIVDRAISFVSPRWSAQRNAWRKIEASYKDGVPTRTSERWQPAQGYRFGTSSDRQQIIDQRSRAYQAYDNNPIARTLVQTECDNVIGDGLNYQPTTNSPEWNREAEDRYYAWLENASVRGADVHTGLELQRLLWERSRVAGDIGWILVSRDKIVNGTLLIDSRIQAVQAENIVTPDGLHADPAVFDGIRYDAMGMPTEFYVLSHDDRGIKRQFIPIVARDFVYLPHMTKPNQARPESCFTTIFDLLAHLDRYVDGVSLAAWMATVMGIIFKQNNAGRQLAALPTLANSKGDQQKAITFENGMVKYIGTDEDVAQVQASQPMQQTPEFIRTMYRMIGQPFDMPLEVIAKDMSTCNFASARIGLLPFYRTCRIKAARFGSRWSRTIRWWLSREQHRSKDDPKRWKTPFPPDFFNHELLVNAWDYTDPVSEAQADLLQIDMKTKSPQMVIAERGRNAEKILREWTEWKDKTTGMPNVRSQMTRDEVNPEDKVVGLDPELERIKAEADAYGVAVRAGVVTPQTDDENAFREKLDLPAMSDDAKKAWEKDEGTRRPITIAPLPGTKPASPFGGAASPAPEEDEATDGTARLGQDVVRGWMIDKDKRDAIWNVSDVAEVLEGAGVKLDPSMDSAHGEGLPMLPEVQEE